MEYTQIDDYPIPAGTVTTWTPTATPSAWRDDPRRLSWDHESHLTGEPDGSWIGSAMRIPGAFDPDTLQRALRAWVARHEVLRTTVRPQEDLWDRVTAHAEQVDVQPVALGHHSGDDAREVIEKFMGALSPTTWPHCVFVTVTDPSASGFVLIFGADHSVMDAYSQLMWFDEMADLYDRAGRGESHSDLAVVDVGSHVDFSASDREVGEVMTVDDPAVDRWRQFVSLDTHGAVADVPGFPHHPDLAHLRGSTDWAPQRSLSTWVLGVTETERLGAMVKQQGFGMQTATLAALAVAARRRSGVERLRFVLPMHTRHDPRHSGAVGWYVGLCPVDLDISGADSFVEIMARAHAAVAATKDLVRRPFPRVAELLDIDDSPHFVISYVDMRFVPGAEHWPSQQARTLRSPAYAPDEAYFWVLRSHSGMNISSRYPGTDFADAAMRGFVANTKAVLSEMVWHAQFESIGAS